MLADFHVHSEFSDDSRTPMAQQIERAIALGIGEICFTEHVDYGIKKDWSEGNIQYRHSDGISSAPGLREPLANVDYPRYFPALEQMKARYQEIRVRGGLEFGIQAHTVPNYENLYQEWKKELDFVLLSVHQVRNREFWTGDYQRGKAQEEYNREYYLEIYRVMQEFHHYSVLAHLDLIVRYDPHGPLPYRANRELIDEILKLAIREDKGIEINTSSWRYGLKDTQPSMDILKRYLELGGRIITTGSDAHKPEYIADHFRDAHRILREIGFAEFCTFEHGVPVFHKLEV